MGTLTQAELETEVRAAMANRDDLDDRLHTALNIAQTQIARVKSWDELNVLYEDTLSYTGVPADDKYLAYDTIESGLRIRRLYSFRLIDGGNSIKLSGITPRKLDTHVPNPLSRGVDKPRVYTRWADKFELFPIPGQAYDYAIRLGKWPTPFVSGGTTATSDLDDKDDAIIAMALHYLYSSLSEYDNAKHWFAVGNKHIEDAIEPDMDEPDRDIRGGTMDTEPSSHDYVRSPFYRGAPR